MSNETREQKEERRMSMGLNNPIHDWWAKRKSQGKWIGGVFIRPELLAKARAMMIEKMEKEKVIQAIMQTRWWYRIYLLFKKIWRKLFRSKI